MHEARARRRRRDNLAGAVVFGVVAVLAILSQVGYVTVGPGAPKPSASASATPTPTPTKSVPAKSLSENRTWTGTLTLNSTKLGISLNGRKAPQAVANFVSLVQSGFYVKTKCWRITTAKDFEVLQCGDPTGDGTGGPGYTFGPLENVPKATVDKSGAKYGVYSTGVLAMARGSSTDSQGSQFFIVYGTTELPAPGYTVFGKVTAGLSALRTAITDKGTSDTDKDGPPKVTTTITGVTVK